MVGNPESSDSRVVVLILKVVSTAGRPCGLRPERCRVKAAKRRLVIIVWLAAITLIFTVETLAC